MSIHQTFLISAQQTNDWEGERLPQYPLWQSAHLLFHAKSYLGYCYVPSMNCLQVNRNAPLCWDIRPTVHSPSLSNNQDQSRSIKINQDHLQVITDESGLPCRQKEILAAQECFFSKPVHIKDNSAFSDNWLLNPFIRR